MLVEGGKILLEGVHRVSMEASQGGLGYGGDGEEEGRDGRSDRMCWGRVAGSM